MVYEKDFSGIYYQSRYGNDLENWALFEPFQIHQQIDLLGLNRENAVLQQACEILGVHLELAGNS